MAETTSTKSIPLGALRAQIGQPVELEIEGCYELCLPGATRFHDVLIDSGEIRALSVIIEDVAPHKIVLANQAGSTIHVRPHSVVGMKTQQHNPQ